jgi:hypothetical protein
MVVTPTWKLKLLLFLGVAEAWLRNFFSTPTKRAQRYREVVNEEAFETWMNGGAEFAKVIEDRITAAGRRGEHGSVRFWQDVLMAAYDFDSYPENRRQREQIATGFYDRPQAAE